MKILVRLPNWLGDVVMSTAFITAVRRIYPESEIDVIIKKELADLAGLIPGINRVHLFSKQSYKGLNGVYRFGKALRGENYDLFFNLPSSLSSLTLAWATKSKKRIGFKSEGGFFLLTDKFKRPLNVHRVDEYLSLLEQFTGSAIGDKKVQLQINGLPKADKNRVLINFNSEAESRRMPLEKGKAIINLLINTFTKQTFVFIGSKKESDFVERLIEGLENRDRIENFAGKTDLRELAELMTNSAVLLTTDSGPCHLANSLGTPVVVLFGAGNEFNTAPYNKTKLDVIRYSQLICEPCIKNTCKLYGIPKCMELLDELKIIAALRVYLTDA